MKQISASVLAAVLLFLLTGCKEIRSLGKGEKDQVIARVGDRSLYLSQIKELVHEGTSAIDSAAVVDAFIQNWIREGLMISEAEKNVATDININKLVDDYRSSLLVYNYEKLLVETKLDTIVTESDKKKFYEINKGQFVLSHPIFKCIIARFPSKYKDLDVVKNLLNNNHLSEAMKAIEKNALASYIDTVGYLSMDDLISLLPENMIKVSEMKSGKIFEKKDRNGDYLVKLVSFYNENEIPPLDFIETKITKTILSERKIQLLKNFREELYEKALNTREFEIFKPE